MAAEDNPTKKQLQEAFDRLQRPMPPRCWLCQRQNPGSTSTLGKDGCRVPVCAVGVGCRDGRIFHGPQGAAHYPGQDCPICCRDSRPVVVPPRRNRRLRD